MMRRQTLIALGIALVLGLFAVYLANVFLTQTEQRAVAVPQGMAYALIAGVEPQYGLYTAIVMTALGSIFGSSRHLINGPTNAISLVVFLARGIVWVTRKVLRVLMYAGHAISAFMLRQASMIDWRFSRSDVPDIHVSDRDGPA